MRWVVVVMSDPTMTKAMVFSILRHAGDFPWRMLDVGLMGLRLDERRECRLHVWNPSLSVGDLPIHDHPFDFTSSIIVGELTNTRYAENSAGDEYVRFRYSPPDEERRRSDTVKLTGLADTLREGEEYYQPAQELHTSMQLPGTVTLVRCSWGRAAPDLTVCLRDEALWRSGRAREATPEEIESWAATALERF